MRVVGLGRYIVLIAVLGLFIGALALFVFGGIATINVVVDAFREGEYNSEGVRTFGIEMVELVDDFLLGAVLFITASGLYQLFISPDLDIPDWMRIEDLEQLKAHLVTVILVMLAILFLGAATQHPGDSILQFGIAVALVIGALGLAVFLFARAALDKRELEFRQEASDQ